MTNVNIKSAVLPDTYSFTNKTDITPAEIIALRESVNWKGESSERWYQCIDQSLAIVGVRDSDKNLIGMACIAGNLRHGVLCDLAVHPRHQRKGIGSAIMTELLGEIQRIGISYLYAELAETNPFRDQMISVGFKETGNSLFMASSS